MLQNRLYQPTLCAICLEYMGPEWTDSDELATRIAHDHEVSSPEAIKQLRMRIYRISLRLSQDGFFETKNVLIHNSNMTKKKFRKK